MVRFAENKQRRAKERVGRQSAFMHRNGGKTTMEPTQALTGDELVRDFQKALRELENALSTGRRSLYRCAYKFLGNAAEAEDAVQDGLLSAYQHLRDFRGDSQMSTWLAAIVRNSARMRLRRRSARQYVSLDEGTDQGYSISEQLVQPGPSPEDRCRESELMGLLGNLGLQLSPSLRKAFELRDVKGVSTQEAAQILGITEGTLKAQLSRARMRMRPLVIQIRGRQGVLVGTRKRAGRKSHSSRSEER